MLEAIKEIDDQGHAAQFPWSSVLPKAVLWGSGQGLRQRPRPPCLDGLGGARGAEGQGSRERGELRFAQTPNPCPG
jgi:hypothetical protein